MQLAFEHVSTDAHRLSFHERSRRMGEIPQRGRAWMPHVDDLLFGVALAGLLALGGAEIGAGIDYALDSAHVTAVVTSAASGRAPG
jgi:hypothetical protein